MNDCILLIVDDDPAFRDAQRRGLRSWRVRTDTGVRVLEAGGGREAVEILEKETVDAVLLDHDMPGGSGLEWLAKIRSVRPDLAVIMVTGRGCEQLAVDAMKAGASDYLVKGTITPADMQRAILNALQKTELQRMIEKQRQTLTEAERQRVMIESLGAACHHLGQPATVIMACLALMRNEHPSPEMEAVIEECEKAAMALGDILKRLNGISTYRTIPYLSDGSSGRIVDV
jgi:DNA-binding NtrC family response regulator